MSPYELRRRLMEDVPEVKIYPILVKSDYTEEEYLEELRDQLAIKDDLEHNRLKDVPIFTEDELAKGLDIEYKNGNYRPKRVVRMPISIFKKE